MFGQLCALPLPLCELLVLGAVALWLVVVPLVVFVELAALAIAAPPPTAAPLMASTVSRVVILRRMA